MARRLNSLLALFFFAAPLLLLRSAQSAQLDTPHWTADPRNISFATSEVSERCTVSLWCSLVLGEKHNNSSWRERLFLRAFVADGSRRGKPIRTALWQVFLSILLGNNVHVNPGPNVSAQTCSFCDKFGRRNQVRFTCSNNECNRTFHATCLKLSEKERQRFRREGNFLCWGCTMPVPSDSFLSLPDICARPETPPLTPRQKNKAASFLCFNARSLKNRKRAADILALLDTHATDIIAINETWLSPNIKNEEVVPPGYLTLRKDRLGGRRPAGGVLLAVRPHLQPRRRTDLETVDAEIIWAEIKISNLRFLVGSAYRAPNSTPAQNTALLNSLQLVAQHQNKYVAVFLMGDFNLDISWRADPPRPGVTPASDFLASFDEMALAQMIRGPTRTTDSSEKTIDLFLCDVPTLVATADVVPGVSDHDALLVELQLQSRRPTPVPKIVPNLQRADWPRVNEALAEKMRSVFTKNDVNSAWEEFKVALFSCIDEHVPKKKSAGKKNLLPWLDKDTKKLLAIKEHFFKQWLELKTPSARETFLAARRATQGALRIAKDRWFWALGRGKNGSNVFWKYIHSKSKVPAETTTFVKEGVVFTSPAEVAGEFNATFQNNFSRETNLLPYMRRNSVVNSNQAILTELLINEEEVLNRLHTLDVKLAAGPDKICALTLVKTAPAIAAPLAHIFSLSLRDSELPFDWKVASVTPLHKDGDKKDFKNYRPISITSLVGKILERYVRDKLVQFLNENNILPAQQHGFRMRRSCTTLLTQTLDEWATVLDEESGAHLHAIFLDWSKAFDKVPFKRLLSKCEHYGIQGNMLSWIADFLEGRAQYVKFGGAKSEHLEVISGVIQGSVLGPTLFNIFVADLPSIIKTNIAQYADDCTIYTKVSSQDDIDTLQEDLARVDVWCANNGMQLNAKKCKVMDITRSPIPNKPLYLINGTALPYVQQERMLGLWISKDLRWNYHVEVQRKKAAQILGFAARNLQGCTPRVKRVAYQSLVKPILTYGTPAWHPGTKTNMEKMERVQNRALHFIHGRRIPPPPQQSLLPIHMQLRFNELLFFKKCLSGDTDFDAMARISQGRALRNTNANRLQPPQARTELGRNIFAYRVVAPWNNLPTVLQDCPVHQFIVPCKKFLWQQL